MSAELGYLRADGHASCTGPLQPQRCRKPDAHGFEGVPALRRAGLPVVAALSGGLPAWRGACY